MVAFPNAAMERSARRVRLLRVRTPDSALRSRIQFGLEEALRLTTLPGEDQGRVYFFRRLRLPALHSNQSSLDWIARCSEQLLAISRSAVHIADLQSTSVDVLYSRDATEPLRLLFSRWIEGCKTEEWFWPQATGVTPELSQEAAVEQLFARWRTHSSGWAAVAREFLPLLRVDQIESALQLIRPETARRWLAAMGRSRPHRPHPIPLPILQSVSSEKLYRTQLRFGDPDPRVRWLCALAILEAAPSLTQDALLPEMAERLLAQSVPHKSFAQITPVELPAKGSRNAVTERFDAGEAEEPSDRNPRADSGRATTFAGLYFLLTPLRLLGIADAYKFFPELAITHLAERVLLRLARSCGVEDDDPVLLPCRQYLGEAPLPPDPLVPPNTLTRFRRLPSSAALTERLWAAAVRRWGRRQTKMRIREIVSRPGRMYATPTALDIVMPMSVVDIRIRRCGLDIDPGYQPWFAQVVHFHYHVEVPHEPRPYQP